MIALVRSELRKVLTTRLWWILLLASLAWVALSLGLVVFASGMEGGLSRDSTEYAGSVWPMGASGTLFVMVIGIMMVTSEYQHRTVNVTFLTSPRRLPVILAKVVAAALISLLFGVVVVGLSSLAAGASILSGGGELNLVDNQVPRILLGSVGAYVVYAMIGVGVGALIRNQVAALVVSILWVFMLEPLLVVVPQLQDVGRWLPGGAVTALYDTGIDYGFGVADLLPVWVAALVLVGYAAVAVALASVTTLRRDVA
ncbi:ABC transporter permease [Nocardiopsis halotolerans]|uniref:ABC transporter permease n=1 Tax=Nocardiopsis halotolerans TaxID=124252 RepID=UPI00034505A1|nr:ABC transporter permease subunit [Nocardiopsis halotolerans]